MESLLDFVIGFEQTRFFAAIMVLAASATLAIFLASLIHVSRGAGSWLRKNRKDAAILAVIFIVAIALRSAMFPVHFPFAGGDFFYTAAGKNIAEHGLYQTCDYTNACLPPKKPYITYPLLLALPFAVAGSSVPLAVGINIAISGLCVIAAYFASYAVFGDRRSALLASFMLSVFIPHIFFTSTTGPHPTSTLFLLISVAAFPLFFRRKDFTSHMLAASSMALCISSRLDHWGFLFFFGLWYLANIRQVRSMPRKSMLPLAVIGLLLVPNALLTYGFAFREGSDASDFGPAFLQGSAAVIVRSMGMLTFSQMWAALAIGGAICAFFAFRRAWIPATFLFPAVLFLIMVLFYEYVDYTALRYLIPGSILCIIALAHLPSMAGRKAAATAIIALAFASPLLFPEEAGRAYSYSPYPLYEFTSSNAELLEQCQIVQCEERVSWAVLDSHAISLSWDRSIAGNPEGLEALAGDGCIFFIETSACAVHMGDTQKEMHETYDLTLMKEEAYGQEWIRLYELQFRKQ